jgi:hypothetical protein
MSTERGFFDSYGNAPMSADFDEAKLQELLDEMRAITSTSCAPATLPVINSSKPIPQMRTGSEKEMLPCAGARLLKNHPIAVEPLDDAPAEVVRVSPRVGPTSHGSRRSNRRVVATLDLFLNSVFESLDIERHFKHRVHGRNLRC